MKMLAILLIMLCLSLGCAHALPVTLECTLPLYNDTGSCATAVGDTCKDLSAIFVYAQQVGRTDSVQVFTQSVAGQFGKTLICSFDRPEGVWDMWLYPQDSTGNRPKCRSNIVRRTVSVSPAQGSMR